MMLLSTLARLRPAAELADFIPANLFRASGVNVSRSSPRPSDDQSEHLAASLFTLSIEAARFAWRLRRGDSF